MIAVLGDEMTRMFKNFNPTEKYIISRTTGMLDNKFAIGKGQLIDLYYFMTFKDIPAVNPIEDPDILMPIVEKQKQEAEEKRRMKERRMLERQQRSFPKVSLDREKVEWW